MQKDIVHRILCSVGRRVDLEKEDPEGLDSILSKRITISGQDTVGSTIPFFKQSFLDRQAWLGGWKEKPLPPRVRRVA